MAPYRACDDKHKRADVAIKSPEHPPHSPTEMAAMTSSFAGVKLNVAAVRISKVRP